MAGTSRSFAPNAAASYSPITPITPNCLPYEWAPLTRIPASARVHTSSRTTLRRGRRSRMTACRGFQSGSIQAPRCQIPRVSPLARVVYSSIAPVDLKVPDWLVEALRGEGARVGEPDSLSAAEVAHAG